MATIKHDLSNVQANKAYVLPNDLDRIKLKEALAKVTSNKANKHACVCEKCGSKVYRKITVADIAKEVGTTRQNLYSYIKLEKIELMRFLQLQKILKCQIVTEQDINIYSNYLKSLLLKGERV